MAASEAKGSLGLILGLLDDLFGGRARVHLFDRRTRVLNAVGVDEPPITAPGPLHRALETAEVVIEHVGAEVPSSWSTPYRAWMPRGDCHLVAARIQGGGEVVGVLSVLRSDSTTVPVAEDRALVGALATRLGRSAAVILMRAASSPASRQVMESNAAVDIDLRTELGARPLIIERLHETRPTADQTLESPPSRASVSAPPGRARLPGGASSVLRFDDDRVEVAMAPGHGPIDPWSEERLVAVLDALARPLADMAPDSGVRLDFAQVEDGWVATVRPRLLAEGWPSKPSIPDAVITVAEGRGAHVDVVADSELGWLVEILASTNKPPVATATSTRNGVDSLVPARAPSAAPPSDTSSFAAPAEGSRVSSVGEAEVERSEESDVLSDLGDDSDIAEAVDLMAVSLGDTAHMLLIAISADARIVFCNDELASRLGRSVADLLGRPFTAVRGSGDGWDEFGELFARAVAEGLAQQSLSWPKVEGSEQQVRWTVSRSVGRSQGQGDGPTFLCFGVDI